VAMELLWNRWRTGRFTCSALPHRYRERASQQAAWEARYPDASSETDRVLTLVCNAFLFHPENRYKFMPDDQLLDIYRAVYHPPWAWFSGDNLEIASLMIDLNLKASDLSPALALADMVDLSLRERI
jgi:hypothetical protein